MPPLLHLIAKRPQLLAEHAEAYAALVAAEVGRVSSTWKRRALLYGLALFSLLVAAVLAGVALMLWAVMPALQAPATWILIVVPLVPIAAALMLLIAAPGFTERGAFESVREQINADIVLLREAAAV